MHSGARSRRDGGGSSLGKYRILGELGQGGMADVFLGATAGPPGFARLIVIKRLRNLGVPEQITMFVDEARIARRLHHPNIVRTHEIDQENGSHYIVMEYLHGPTLFRLRRAGGSQSAAPWPIEIDIACNVLQGLHYAHELTGLDGRPLRVVHRDLSPENVIVTRRGETKILDFGIAKAIDSISQTQAGAWKGKLRNMPPEQLRGERVDRRADVYAAGVTLWEGLTGRSLWGDLGNVEIAARLARADVPSVNDFATALPSALREICARAMEIRPENRYPSALDFRNALSAYAQRNDLVVPRAEMAAYVEGMFADERARIERIAGAVVLEADGEPVVALDLDDLTPAPEPAEPARTRTRVASASAARTPAAPALPAPPDSFAPPAPARARRKVPLLVAAVLVPPTILATVWLAAPHRPPVVEEAAPRAPERPTAGERPVAVEPVPVEMARPPRASSPGARTRPTPRRAARGPAVATSMAASEERTPREQPRAQERILDLDNPYAGPRKPAAAKPPPPAPTIDPTNPWQH
jgi:tRNA A-37 threonylcarbamoyl transferase component Bud32